MERKNRSVVICRETGSVGKRKKRRRKERDRQKQREKIDGERSAVRDINA